MREPYKKSKAKAILGSGVKMFVAAALWGLQGLGSWGVFQAARAVPQLIGAEDDLALPTDTNKPRERKNEGSGSGKGPGAPDGRFFGRPHRWTSGSGEREVPGLNEAEDFEGLERDPLPESMEDALEVGVSRSGVAARGLSSRRPEMRPSESGSPEGRSIKKRLPGPDLGGAVGGRTWRRRQAGGGAPGWPVRGSNPGEFRGGESIARGSIPRGSMTRGASSGQPTTANGLTCRDFLAGSYPAVRDVDSNLIIKEIVRTCYEKVALDSAEQTLPKNDPATEPLRETINRRRSQLGLREIPLLMIVLERMEAMMPDLRDQLNQERQEFTNGSGGMGSGGMGSAGSASSGTGSAGAGW